MISRSNTLHQLWSGIAKLPRREETRAFDAALDALCPARRQVIELACPTGGGRVLLDDTEVMPMISLGDVVAEEFDLSLPYGTLLLFVPHEELVDDAPADLRAAAIGRICGEIVSETVYRGAFPLIEEARIAGALMAACLQRARSVPFGGPRARNAFERGLVDAARDVTTAQGSTTGHPSYATSGIFAELDARLTRLAHAAEAPDFDAWLETVRAATCTERDAPGEHAAASLFSLAAVPPPLRGLDSPGDE